MPIPGSLSGQVTDGFGRSDLARCWAGFASLGAGLVHLAVVHEHLAQWWVYGVFFAVVGTLQIGWAMLALARDDMPLPRVVAGLNAGVIVLWLVTRTTGLPVGPQPWTPEAFGTSDTLCAVLQAVVVVLLVAALLSEASAGPDRRLTGPQLALLAVGALVMAAVTTPALAATEAGAHAHPMGGMHMR